MRLPFKNLSDFHKAFPDELTCIEFVSEMRWNGKPVCTHCSSDKNAYKIQQGKKFKCSECRTNFTVKTGTIFEDSPISLYKWFLAIYLISSNKKGISSINLGQQIGVTQKTAWFMNHRIRFAMSNGSFESELNNTVEIDETYFGGKNKNKHQSKRLSGTGTANKQAVFGMIERKGNVKAFPVKKTDGETLVPIIIENVAKGTNIMTDEHGAYYYLGNNDYKHEVVNHTQGQYVKGHIHTQNIENFWSLLKRGIYGIYHQVSPKHLHRYCNEYAFRFNSRVIENNQRFEYTFTKINGRLDYKTLIGK